MGKRPASSEPRLFFIEPLGLATTTVLGTWIGLTHAKRRSTALALLTAGTGLPIALIEFTR